MAVGVVMVAVDIVAPLLIPTELGPLVAREMSRTSLIRVEGYYTNILRKINHALVEGIFISTSIIFLVAQEKLPPIPYRDRHDKTVHNTTTRLG